MIAQSPVPGASASRIRPRWGLTALIAAHATADVLIACAARWFLGLKEFWVFPFVAGGVACGQAVLLAQFLFLGVGRASARALLAATWFAFVYFLARPIVASVGGPGAASEVGAVMAVPSFLSALPAVIHLAGGRRIRPRDTSTKQPEQDTFQFSLRRLFALTLATAIVLAIVRLGREKIMVESDVILYFGIIPLLHAFLLVPSLSPWAALGTKHPGWRCFAIVLLALVCGISPAFVGKATATTYAMLVGTLVLQALVVTGSLLIVRWLGYRFVSRESFPIRTRIYRYPPRF